MEYLIDYLMFAAKFLTVMISLAVPVVVVLAFRHGRQSGELPNLEITRVNDRIRNTALNLESALLPGKQFKQRVKAQRKEEKARANAKDDSARKRVFVLEFDGDIRAHAVEQLREEVTGVIAVAQPDDEVVVVLESGGGTIHGYGLGASQLTRLRERDLRLTVVVDRIAASGGYMMACVADEIVAAPFAIIGSIGVVAQFPNFNRLLKKHDIDFEEITAGKYKRTLTMFGENTAEDRDKVQSELNEAHVLFQAFIEKYRPQVDLALVATGEYWFGSKALELKLIDQIATSDDLIYAAIEDADVFRISAQKKSGMLEKLTDTLGRVTAPPL